MFVIFDVGNYYLGLVIYTKYKDCDPVSAGVSYNHFHISFSFIKKEYPKQNNTEM